MRNYSKYINPYIKSIKSNKVAHCKDQELMLDNIVLPVLERDDIYIDEERIEKGLALQKYFPYKLIEWEVFLFALIVGVLFKKNDNIFFTDIRIIVGRGSGKNGFISFLSFYFLSPAHGIRGYNVDLLANSEEQAKTSFTDVFEIIKEPHDPSLRRALSNNYHATKEVITGTVTKSMLRFNTSSKRGKDSKRTGCIIYDEKHEYEDFTNINTLRSGLGKVWHGREITITTDGHVRGGVFDKEKDQNEEILRKYDPNNRTLVFWCRIEDESEWNQMDKLVKAMPSLNDFPALIDTVQKEIKGMPSTPDYWYEYMAKRCNFPIGDKNTVVAEYQDIQMASKQEMVDLSGMECVGGVDYSMTNDFTTCLLLFKAAGKTYILQHTFICLQSRDLKGIKAPLDEWVKKGHAEYVDDVEISAKLVADWFSKMGMKYRIKKIAVDKFRYSYLSEELRKRGFEPKTTGSQGNLYLLRRGDNARVSPLINSLFINHNIVWGDQLIMNWFTNNVKKASNGTSIYFEKIEPNYRKTDGFMAFVAAMAIQEELDQTETVSIDVIENIPTFTF